MDVFEAGVFHVLVEDSDGAVEIVITASGCVGGSVDSEAPVIVVATGLARDFVAVAVSVTNFVFFGWLACVSQLCGPWWPGFGGEHALFGGLGFLRGHGS